MRRLLVVAFAVLGVWACGRPAAQASTTRVNRDTLTQRQKDSIVGTMPLPGAKKIGEAQRAVDKLNANSARLDSIH